MAAWALHPKAESPDTARGSSLFDPVEAIDPVREHPKRPQPWTQDQVRAFLRININHRHFATFYTLVTTGLRRGELLGLRWEDVGEDGL